MPLGHSFRPLLRGRGRRSAPSLPSRYTYRWERAGVRVSTSQNSKLLLHESLRAAAEACVIVEVQQVEPGRNVFTMLRHFGVEFVEISARFGVCWNPLPLEC